MKYVRLVVLSGLLCGMTGIAHAGTTYFDVTDVPGYWFDTGNTNKVFAGTRSLAIVTVQPGAVGEKIKFLQESSKFGPAGINGPSRVEALHTITSLIWPSNAKPEEFLDQNEANQKDQEVTLSTPGLHVFVCKLHPYMLAGVIVDDPTTTTKNEKNETVPAYDIGDKLRLLGLEAVGPFDSLSNLGLRLLRAFFIVTTPSNWKDYTKVGHFYKPVYPDVPVVVTGKVVVDSLNDALQATFDLNDKIEPQKKPKTKGVGEVWVDTQYELTTTKGLGIPGTISVVEVDALFAANNWKVKRKIALPKEKMNNGHNMWASHNQQQIYQTEWHGKSLFVIDRFTGKLLKEFEVGPDPAHVMTRVDTRQVHVTLNGADGVRELDPRPAPNYLQMNPQVISMQHPGQSSTTPTQPHAHWMGYDGRSMATPNANSHDSSLFDFNSYTVIAKNPTGTLPIAVGMMPDSTKYYVSNYLGHTLSVMHGPASTTGTPGTKIKDIQLLGNYDPKGGLCGGAPCANIGALPIQTPVSPDGKFVITGNTLTGTITIVSTKTDEVVKTITCDPGCHGVNFGAKKGGGYYAYVTSKFANRLIVLDYDPNRDGYANDAEVAGWVVLANNTAPSDDKIIPTDEKTNGNNGMGGQGVLPVPNVYNGWVQELPAIWKIQLTHAQRHPFPTAENHHTHGDDRE